MIKMTDPVTKSDLQEMCKSFESQIKSTIREELKSAHNQLQNDVDQIRNDTETLFRNEKRNNIIVIGIPESSNETHQDRDKVIENLSTQLKIAKIDYDYANRIGRKNHAKPRPILIRLIRNHEKYWEPAKI